MKLIRETMKANPKGCECSACGEDTEAPIGVKASLCWRCTQERVQAYCSATKTAEETDSRHDRRKKRRRRLRGIA